jgi:hypothetical protein
MTSETTPSVIGPVSPAEENLVLAVKIGDLQGMQEAIEQGARPHFWFVSSEDDHEEKECPATIIISNTTYEMAVKLRALNILHKAGVLFCAPGPRGETVLKDLCGHWLGDESELIEWFIQNKVGMTFEEGVEHWLKHTLPLFKDDYPTRVLRHLASVGPSSVEILSMMAGFCLLSGPGRCCLVISNEAAPEQERVLATDRLLALTEMLPFHFNNMRMLKLMEQSIAEGLLSSGLLEIMSTYPNEAHASRALSLFTEAVSRMPGCKIQDWKSCIDDFSKGGLLSDNDGHRRAWMCQQANAWFAHQQALSLEGTTQPVLLAVNRIRF